MSMPTRICGAAGRVVGVVTVASQQSAGSSALVLLCIPVFTIAMAIGVLAVLPEHDRNELNAIII